MDIFFIHEEYINQSREMWGMKLHLWVCSGKTRASSVIKISEKKVLLPNCVSPISSESASWTIHPEKMSTTDPCLHLHSLTSGEWQVWHAEDFLFGKIWENYVVLLAFFRLATFGLKINIATAISCSHQKRKICLYVFEEYVCSS